MNRLARPSRTPTSEKPPSKAKRQQATSHAKRSRTRCGDTQGGKTGRDVCATPHPSLRRHGYRQVRPRSADAQVMEVPEGSLEPAETGGPRHSPNPDRLPRRLQGRSHRHRHARRLLVRSMHPESPGTNHPGTSHRRPNRRRASDRAHACRCFARERRRQSGRDARPPVALSSAQHRVHKHPPRILLKRPSNRRVGEIIDCSRPIAVLEVVHPRSLVNP